MPSLSRQFSSWVHDLRYEDLPAEVIDRAKGVSLQALSSALIGHGMADAQQMLRMMRAEEPGTGGEVSVLVDGTRLTRGSAAMVNAELIFCGGKWDTFRMLTHPGCAIVPAALTAAQITGASGREFITALAAAYEVMERMAADFIPTVMSRGFHAGPVFGIFGAAVAAAKLMKLDTEQIHGAIAQCVNLASGNLEGIRSGGRSLREGAAVRNALLAVAMARHGARGGETVLEGQAGFYHSYAGNNLGELKYSFSADNRARIDTIADGLGDHWMFLETLYRIYSTAGFNIAHIDVTAALCNEHDIRAAQVERIEAVVNWLETEYPSPAFPTPAPADASRGPRVGSTAYYSAYGVVQRGFPLLKYVDRGTGAADPPEVLELMHKVSLIPSHRQPLFAPTITIHLKDGRSFTRASTGREFIWDFAQLCQRIGDIEHGLPIPATQYRELMAACGNLDGLTRAEQLIALTMKNTASV